MPGPVSSCCSTSITPTISTATRAYANLGYVGFVKLVSGKLMAVVPGISEQTLRVMRASPNMRQDIEKPEVIDGRIDPTVYRVGPKIVEGELEMPIIAETFARDTCPTAGSLQGENTPAGRLLQLIWCWATTRDSQGRPYYDDVDAYIRYANHSVFKYTGMTVAEMSMRANAEDILSATLSCYAFGRTPVGASPGERAGASGYPIGDYLSPARVLTWNDVSVTGIRAGGACASGTDASRILFPSNLVRNWHMRVNNNPMRVYTLNGSLYPADITHGKREVTGSVEILGEIEDLRVLAETNADRFTEKNEIRFAFYVGGDTFSGSQEFRQRDWLDSGPSVGYIFARKMVGVVFQPEERELSRDVYKTTYNYHAMAQDDDAIYEAFSPGTSFFPAWSTVVT